MSSRAKFEQSQTEPMQINSRVKLRTHNRKKNLSERRIEPTLLRYTPEILNSSSANKEGNINKEHRRTKQKQRRKENR